MFDVNVFPFFNRELEKAAKSLKMGNSNNRLNRLIGGKVNRSSSVTF